MPNGYGHHDHGRQDGRYHPKDYDSPSSLDLDQLQEKLKRAVASFDKSRGTVFDFMEPIEDCKSELLSKLTSLGQVENDIQLEAEWCMFFNGVKYSSMAETKREIMIFWDNEGMKFTTGQTRHPKWARALKNWNAQEDINRVVHMFEDEAKHRASPWSACCDIWNNGWGDWLSAGDHGQTLGISEQRMKWLEDWKTHNHLSYFVFRITAD